MTLAAVPFEITPPVALLAVSTRVPPGDVSIVPLMAMLRASVLIVTVPPGFVTVAVLSTLTFAPVLRRLIDPLLAEMLPARSRLPLVDWRLTLPLPVVALSTRNTALPVLWAETFPVDVRAERLFARKLLPRLMPVPAVTSTSPPVPVAFKSDDATTLPPATTAMVRFKAVTVPLVMTTLPAALSVIVAALAAAAVIGPLTVRSPLAVWIVSESPNVVTGPVPTVNALALLRVMLLARFCAVNTLTFVVSV